MEHRKMDKRMTGHEDFGYCATFFKTVREGQKFCDIRDWCWDNWGNSCEYEFWNGRPAPNQHWCWANDEHKIKIYFKTDVEYTLFLLRWI
jgi:hypothetical protein